MNPSVISYLKNFPSKERKQIELGKGSGIRNYPFYDQAYEKPVRPGKS